MKVLSCVDMSVSVKYFWDTRWLSVMCEKWFFVVVVEVSLTACTYALPVGGTINFPFPYYQNEIIPLAPQLHVLVAYVD